jgi:hypothetical protein
VNLREAGLRLAVLIDGVAGVIGCAERAGRWDLHRRGRESARALSRDSLSAPDPVWDGSRFCRLVMRYKGAQSPTSDFGFA